MAGELRGFLSELATDPKRLGAYISDPEGALAESGLDEETRQILRSGDLARINGRLMAEGGEGGAQAAPNVVVISDLESLREKFAGAGQGQAAAAPVTHTVWLVAAQQGSPAMTTPYGASYPMWLVFSPQGAAGAQAAAPPVWFMSAQQAGFPAGGQQALTLVPLQPLQIPPLQWPLQLPPLVFPQLSPTIHPMVWPIFQQQAAAPLVSPVYSQQQAVPPQVSPVYSQQAGLAAPAVHVVEAYRQPSQQAFTNVSPPVFSQQAFTSMAPPVFWNQAPLHVPPLIYPQLVPLVIPPLWQR